VLDLVLENGRIVDGTGNPWFFGGIGIKDGMIVGVGRVSQERLETLDVRGQVISPGFIDGHCHSDLMVLDNPRSEIKLQQGVTTEVLGNCGMTPAPFAPQNLELLRSYVEPVLGKTELEWSWETVEQYMGSLREARPSENFATYVGHGTLRIAVMDLLLQQNGKVSMVFFHMAETDVQEVLGWDGSLIASDSLHDQARKPHPRLYGTFPHVLARYVRDRKLLTLEEAIRKMTSFPARRFRLGKRGLIAPGYTADLVVFDPDGISDKATYHDPKRFPEGISHVLVNGTQTIASGVHLGARAGRAIEGRSS
jgi:N-acyl-D-aspartate/D-glutamate deacylase